MEQIIRRVYQNWTPPAGDSFNFNWMLAYSQNTVDFLIVWKLKKFLQQSVVSSIYKGNRIEGNLLHRESLRKIWNLRG